MCSRAMNGEGCDSSPAEEYALPVPSIIIGTEVEGVMGLAPGTAAAS